jgi:hypothetical protein
MKFKTQNSSPMEFLTEGVTEPPPLNEELPLGDLVLKDVEPSFHPGRSQENAGVFGGSPIPPSSLERE